jgi:hypothetical protein
MRLLPAKRLEAEVADDASSREMLELGRIRAGLGREVDQALGALEAAVVIGRYVRDEVSGVLLAHGAATDDELPIRLVHFE